MPAIKEQWTAVTTYAEPRLQLLTTKYVQVYEKSKSAITPHVVKLQEIVDPYYQV